MNPTLSSPLIQLSHVYYQQGGRDIIENVSLSVFPAEIVSIIGPNGSGKTTLIKLLLGLLPLTRGRIQRAPGLTIGYMPQKLYIDPNFPISVMRFLSLGFQGTESQIREHLAHVGFKPKTSTPMSRLSGGEFQRVLLARALLRKPQLLVLDEPVQGVDVMGQSELYDLIASLSMAQGQAVLLVSHDLHVVMAKTHRVVCLNQHICCEGNPERVSQDPAFGALFGRAAEGLALYKHEHDHDHHD